MSYLARRWRLSDLKVRPSSRQTMWSAVTDFFTGTAGVNGPVGTAASTCPPTTCISEACTRPMSWASSPGGTGLLLT